MLFWLRWLSLLLPARSESQFNQKLAMLAEEQDRLRKRIIEDLINTLPHWLEAIAEGHALAQPQVTVQLAGGVTDLKRRVRRLGSEVRPDVETAFTDGWIRHIGYEISHAHLHPPSRLGEPSRSPALPRLATFERLVELLMEVGYKPGECAGVSNDFDSSTRGCFVRYYYLSERASAVQNGLQELLRRRQADEATRIWRSG